MIKKFYKPDCVPCAMLSRTLSFLGVEVESIDITLPENVHYVHDYSLTSVPTLVREDGEVLRGNTTMLQLKRFLNL